MTPKPNGAVALTSTEVNYLIYRYLQESGLHHTAFTFAHESQVHRCDVDPNLVPPAALVTYIQKGMQYLEAEANIDESGEVGPEFALLDPQDIMTRDLDELRQLALEKREKQADKAAPAAAPAAAASKQGRADRKRERAGAAAAAVAAAVKEEPGGGAAGGARGTRAAAAVAAAAAAAGDPMDTDALAVAVAGVEQLAGHEEPVALAAYNPSQPLLASAGMDGTVRLWDLASGANHGKALILRHPAAKDGEKPPAGMPVVTALAWSPDGSQLASGSHNGLIRVWAKDGSPRWQGSRHQGAVLSLRWSKRGELLLSACMDTRVIVWQGGSGEVKQEFETASPTLDADWRNANTFAACALDGSVRVFRLGQDSPIKTFSGHGKEVLFVRWDPQAKLLASCSDDGTVKLWQMTAREEPPVSLQARGEITALRWSPGGPGSANPGQPLLLGVACSDGSVQLWDADAAKAVRTLSGHSAEVSSIAFSPDGRLLATSSKDQSLRLWSVADGSLLATHAIQDGLSDPSWSKSGDCVAGWAGKMAVVLSLRRSG